YVSEEVAASFHEAGERGAELQAEWEVAYRAFEEAEPEAAESLNLALKRELRDGWDSDLPAWEPGSKPISTRKASGEVINAFAPRVPTFIGGSAALDPSAEQ